MALAPGLEGFVQGRQDAERSGLAAFQQAGLVAQLGDTLEKHALAQEYRAAIAAAKTPEEAAQIAARFSGPEGVLKSADRRAALDVKRSGDQSRLFETARMNDSLISHRISQEQNANTRVQLERQRDQMRNFYNQKSLEVGGEKLFYDTGRTVSTAAPVPTAGATGAVAAPPLTSANPAPASVAAPSGLEAELAGRPPAEQAALQAVADAGNTPMTVDVGGYKPTAPAFTPALAPRPSYEDANDRQIAGGGMGGGAPAPAPIPAPLPTPNQTATPSPIPTAAVTQPAATPAMPTMPPEIAAAPLKVQNKWRMDQAKTSVAGGGQFSPQALAFTAKQYLSGDRQAIQGFARNATARIALQNEIVDEATRRGMTPEQVAAQMADFAGTMAGSRTVGQRAANISLAATEAEEMIPVVKEQSDKFSRTNFVPWNMALKAYESGTGAPEIAAFGASVNALVNVYARAINPTGVPTISDKEHARAVLNTVQSPAQVDAVLGIIRRELEIAKKAPTSVREATRQRVTGQPASSTDKPTADQFFR